MRIQIRDMRNDTKEVIEGTADQLESKLRLMFHGATSHIADGYLGNVIQAVSRIQHIALKPLDAVPEPMHNIPKEN